MTTYFQKQHLSRVHELPCGVCGSHEGIEAHHILEGRTPGRKSPDILAIPICADCHKHPIRGIHGQGYSWKLRKVSELDILADTIEKLYG